MDKPHNCLLGFALPLTKEDFLHDLELSADKDYAKSRMKKLQLQKNALWEIDHKPLTIMVLEMMQELEQMGVSIVKNFSFRDLSGIKSYGVFTLFAHWVSDLGKVELFDGLIDAKSFVNELPSDFEGTIDLTVCNSIFLQHEIHKKFQNVVVSNERTTSVEFRLITYKYCMKYLQGLETDYVTAVGEIRKNL